MGENCAGLAPCVHMKFFNVVKFYVHIHKPYIFSCRVTKKLYYNYSYTCTHRSVSYVHLLLVFSKIVTLYVATVQVSFKQKTIATQIRLSNIIVNKIMLHVMLS